MSHYNPDLDPVMQKDFIEVINTMAEVFPNINNKARIKYYFDAVKNEPLKALRDISKKFLMSSKQMPLPSDFVDAISEWKRANKKYVADDAPVKIDCLKCNDLGIMILNKSEGSYYSLINCDCKHCVHQDLKAPKWSNELRGGFYTEVCPLDWFKPKDVTEFKIDSPEITKISTNWKTKKNEAEKFWSDLGYKHY